jgi:hypothetical protein
VGTLMSFSTSFAPYECTVYSYSQTMTDRVDCTACFAGSLDCGGACSGSQSKRQIVASRRWVRRVVGLYKLQSCKSSWSRSLESTWFQPLSLWSENPVSKFAFKFNLYRYSVVLVQTAGAAANANNIDDAFDANINARASLNAANGGAVHVDSP